MVDANGQLRNSTTGQLINFHDVDLSSLQVATALNANNDVSGRVVDLDEINMDSNNMSDVATARAGAAAAAQGDPLDAGPEI